MPYTGYRYLSRTRRCSNRQLHKQVNQAYNVHQLRNIKRKVINFINMSQWPTEWNKYEKLGAHTQLLILHISKAQQRRINWNKDEVGGWCRIHAGSDKFIWGWQPEGRRPLGRPRRRREHIKLGLKVIGWEGVGWIQFDQCRVLVRQFVCLLVCYDYLHKSFMLYETVLSSKPAYF